MDLIEEYVKRILKVQIYIEKNIDEEMSLDSLAKVACYSPFHFHRVFAAVSGETVHEYVKRLRMDRAASRLLYTDKPVTEIALDSNYETPSAFTKAFKQWMGASPKRYRALYAAVNLKIKEYPMIQPDKIEKNLPDLNLLFIRRCGSYATTPREAWIAMNQFIEENRLNSVRRFGFAHDDPKITSEDKLRFDAAILAEGIKEKGEVGRQVLKGGKYAIFTHLGAYQGQHQGLEETFNRIFLKWLPNAREKFDESRLAFCEYFHMEYVRTEPEKLVTKIYIPLS